MKVSTQRFKLKRLVLITGLVFGMAACGNDDLAPPPSPPAANNAPVITTTALTTADEGQAYTYTFTATDADGDALTRAATTIPSWLTFDAATGVLSGTPADTDVGNNDVTLTVTDGEATETQSFTIVVTAAPDQVAPVFTSTALVTGKVGTSYSYTATATDGNFDTLEFSAVTVPAWAQFDETSATLSGIPDVVGDYAVELMVSDGTDAVTQAFTITIVSSDIVTVELSVFENVALPEWAAWTDNGGPTEVVTDDLEHDQVTQFSLTKASVAGFSGRPSETDSGAPFDASGLLSNGSIRFELKLITAPTAGTVPWFLKVEGTGASEVLLSSSVEGHASPMLDTWQTYTFPLSTLVAAGSLNASTINLFMVFPSYNDATGAVYYLDNFQIISIEGGATNDSELLTNGDFETGLASWKSDVGSVVADGTNNIFEADVQAAGNAYDVNQSQVIPITEGATYTMSFKAKASVARTMIAGLGQNAAPFNAVTQTPALTTEWQTFSYDLVADGIGGETSRVLFDMGAEVGIINIDDVSVQLKAVEPVDEPVVELGPETLTNGDFESGLDSWRADVGSVVADGTNSLFEADVQAAGNAYDVNQSQIIPIIEGASYTMSFKAKASVARTMIAGLGQNAAPYNSVTQTPALTTEWQTFSYVLVAGGIGGETSRVLFDMGAEVGIVNIDDVSVKLTDGSTGAVDTGPAAGIADIGDTGFVTNGGFETTNLDGWNPTGANITVEQDDLGSYLVKIIAGEAGTPNIRQERIGAGTITAGQDLTVSFDMRGTAVNGGIVNVLVYTDDDVAVPSVTKTEVLFADIPSEEWTSYSYSVTAGDPAGWGLSLLMQPTCGAVTDCKVTAYFDNISITAQ
ncbi:MAG: hypothetical protein ACI9MS_002009 [Glaciecola sp.]|jgi:hypothetical protein